MLKVVDMHLYAACSYGKERKLRKRLNVWHVALSLSVCGAKRETTREPDDVRILQSQWSLWAYRRPHESAVGKAQKKLDCTEIRLRWKHRQCERQEEVEWTTAIQTSTFASRSASTRYAAIDCPKLTTICLSFFSPFRGDAEEGWKVKPIHGK